MSFCFGFGGDDFDDNIGYQDNSAAMEVEYANTYHALEATELVEAQNLDLDELMASLPSMLHYRLHTIPSDLGSSKASDFMLPRRELHDIRTQIMAETDPSNVDRVLEAGLSGSGDLSSGVYEGGFKTWECSYDLAVRVKQKLNATQDSIWANFVELGAGTALPSSVVLDHLLRQHCSVRDGEPRTLVLADYNEAVLQLATLPNIFLTWYEACKESVSRLSHSFDPEEDNAVVEVTEELKEAFRLNLQSLGIRISLVAGCWGPKFTQVLYKSLGDSNSGLLVMASETIYSPSAVRAFSNTVIELLHRNRRHGRAAEGMAIVAAKQIYFGVGGGVDEFKEIIRALGSSVSDEWIGGQGVGRWLGDIQA